MIPSIRLDLGLDELCAVLAGSTSCDDARPSGVRPAPTDQRVTRRVVYPVSRGRDGLAWVLGAHGVGAGDEVLVTDLMCDTVGEAVRTTGARLVTYGLAPGSFLPCPEACAQAVSSRAKALIVPHLFGMRTDLAAFASLAEEHGLLLIEDSALAFPVDEDGVCDYRTPAGCVLYSFNYGKPLSVGWGGLVSLSPRLADRLGSPPTVPMDADDDRFYAAASLVGHALTDPGRRLDPARRRDQVVRADAGLHLLVEDGGGDRPAVPDRAAVDAVFAAAEEGPDAVLAWCCSRATGARRCSRRHSVPAADEPEATMGDVMEVLRPAGCAERLLDLQRFALKHGAGAERRRAAAVFYSANLDPSRWTFPEADQAAYWLSYPVAAKHPAQRDPRVRRDGLVRTIAGRLAVDVHPYVWPDVLHRIPGLRGTVIAGPGCEESAQLVDGLLNLPVHGQLSRETAEALVRFLNDERRG